MFDLIRYTGMFLLFIIFIYSLILTARIILSWVILPPYPVIQWIYKLTDPVLRLCKKYFPLRIGIIDLSVLIPFAVILLLSTLIRDLMVDMRPLTPLYAVILLLSAINLLISSFFFIMGLFTVILFLVILFAPATYNPMVTAIKSVMSPVILFIRRIIPIRHRNADLIYLGILFALIAGLSLLSGILMNLSIATLNGIDDSMRRGLTR